MRAVLQARFVVTVAGGADLAGDGGRQPRWPRLLRGAFPASYPPGSPKLDTFRDIGDSAVQIDKVVTDMKAQG